MTACPTLPKRDCWGGGLVKGLAYAPGIGTEAYVCSPGAAATCSMTRSFCGAGAGADSKPFCAVLGVAEWTLIGGGWRANGFFSMAYEGLASTKRVPAPPAIPSSAVGPDWYADGGNLGDFMCCEYEGDMGPKPGVFGAD